MGRYRNVPDDWDSYWSRCSSCGNKYHASEGGCPCEDRKPEPQPAPTVTYFVRYEMTCEVQASSEEEARERFMSGDIEKEEYYRFVCAAPKDERNWLKEVDELLQEIGEGHELYPLTLWERLRDCGLTPEAAIELVKGGTK